MISNDWTDLYTGANTAVYGFDDCFVTHQSGVDQSACIPSTNVGAMSVNANGCTAIGTGTYLLNCGP